MKLKSIIFICILLLVSPALIFAQPVSGEDLVESVEGDGSSIDKAIHIKNISDYTVCVDKGDVDRVYAETVNQENEILAQKFGKEGEGWKLLKRVTEGEKFSDEFIGLSQFNNYYDKVNIVLLPSDEEKTFYFDVTEACEAYKKAVDGVVESEFINDR